MKRVIFPADFYYFYPSGITPCKMYVDVANRIYHAIKNSDLLKHNDNETIMEIAMCVAMYYEDKMSEIGLWNAFVTIYRQLYSHSMPFFECDDEYDINDVNVNEVALLIWIVLTRNSDGDLTCPSSKFVQLAHNIMDLLHDDEVEENKDLYSFIYNKDNASDFFKLKHTLFWMRRSYLLRSPFQDISFAEALGEFEAPFDFSQALYALESDFLRTKEIGPLALLAHQWLAQMFSLNDMHEEADKLNKLQFLHRDLFRVLSNTKKLALIKDSHGERHTVINYDSNLFENHDYISSAFVKCADNYWEIDGFVVDSTKMSYEQLREINKEKKKFCLQLYTTALINNKRKQLDFFENKGQLFDLFDDMYSGTDLNPIMQQLPDTSLVVQFSKENGIIVATGCLHAVKSNDNPYYQGCDDKSVAIETVNTITGKNYIHPVLLQYMLQNNMLPHGDINTDELSAEGNKIFNQHIDFIARHFLRDNYHPHNTW
ncbi:MAG: DUF3843 family protein [Muribaculaceae bacterium]|nr:DUF3843 family protein [Muribaculaceae bacterium]